MMIQLTIKLKSRFFSRFTFLFFEVGHVEEHLKWPQIFAYKNILEDLYISIQIKIFNLLNVFFREHLLVALARAPLCRGDNTRSRPVNELQLNSTIPVTLVRILMLLAYLVTTVSILLSKIMYKGSGAHDTSRKQL